MPTTGPNALVIVDDDDVVGANGNPGGPGDLAPQNTSGTLSGSGGDGSLTFALTASGAPAGFSYALQGNGDLWVMQGATHVLTITVNAATGAYTVTEVAPIDHVAGGNENNANFAITYTVTDADGDHSNGTLSVEVNDDTPTLGTIQAIATDNNPADDDPTFKDGTGSLHLSMGADGFASVLISPDLTGITSGGHALVGQQVGNVYTAYADVDGSGTVNAGDTAVFTITVDPNGGTSGTYTFDLLQALDPVVTPINIGAGSSFGVGPSQSVVVTDNASGTNLVFVTGWAPTASFDNAAWLAGGNPSLTQTSNVNGSTAGWGLGNNNLDAGEFMRFDFGALNDYDGAGPYTPPGTPTVAEVSFATFSFKNFGSGDTIEFVAHYEDGTTQDFVLSNGSPSSLTITAPPGTNIAWVDVLESDGSIKINLDQVGVVTSAIDDTIPVDMTFTDGDGDTVTGSTTITVSDGGGTTTPNVVVQGAATQSTSDGGKTSNGDSHHSLVGSNDNGAHDHRPYALAQNITLLAALAVAGLEAEQNRLDPHALEPCAQSRAGDGAAGSADGCFGCNRSERRRHAYACCSAGPCLARRPGADCKRSSPRVGLRNARRDQRRCKAGAGSDRASARVGCGSFGGDDHKRGHRACSDGAIGTGASSCGFTAWSDTASVERLHGRCAA